jgi:hypothetical protein
MAYKENLTTEERDLQYTIRRLNRILVELEECLSGLSPKQLDYIELKESEHHRLKIVKGMSNYDLDFQTYQTCRLHDFLSDYSEKLCLELDKRAKYSLIPTDGSDWEVSDNGLPSIGPRIDAIETIEEDEKRYA